MPIVLQWTNDDTNALETFQFDVVTSLSQDDESTPTEHPVEEGVVVSDHVRDTPDALSIEGLITNTPHSGNYTDDDKANYSDQPLALSVPTRKTGGTQTLALDVKSPPLQPHLDSLIGTGLGALGNLISGGPTATMNSPSTDGGTQSVTVTVKQPTTPKNRAREAYEKLLGAKLAHDLIVVETSMRSYFDMLITRVSQPQAVEDGESFRFQIDLRRLRFAETQTVQAPKPTEVRALAGKTTGSQAAKPDENPELHSHAYDALPDSLKN